MLYMNRSLIPIMEIPFLYPFDISMFSSGCYSSEQEILFCSGYYPFFLSLISPHFFQVYYTFNPIFMLAEPLMLASVFFLLFIAAVAYLHIDPSIRKWSLELSKVIVYTT